MPKFVVPINIRKNGPINNVQMLTQLEEHLVSLRIAFSQIWEVGYKKSQLGLRGSIISVLVNIDTIQNALPLSLSNTSIVVVSLTQCLRYKNAFQKGMV